jgi:hypothetical protein
MTGNRRRAAFRAATTSDRLAARTALHVATAVLGIILASRADAHEIRPAYVELRETAVGEFDLTAKVPARGRERLALHPVLPDGCTASFVRETWTGDAHVAHAVVRCPGGLTGRITVEGLTGTMVDVLLRIVRLDGSAQVSRLTAAAPSAKVEPAPRSAQVAVTYLVLGMEHIVLGVDHLLFVLALLVLVGPTRRLVSTVTAFTIAHSLTLAAATLGVVDVPTRPIEAMIALSIVFVAAEIVHARQGRAGLTMRQPWVVAFIFGLLHGFGFAGALAEVGLPAQAIPLALLFFNLGVELGQLLFVALLVAVSALVGGAPLPRWSWAGHVPPYAIGALAAYWTIERLTPF